MLLYNRKVGESTQMSEGRRTSYRTLTIERGLSIKPTPTLVVAPDMRFPVLVSVGRTEELAEFVRGCLYNAANEGELAI